MSRIISIKASEIDDAIVAALRASEIEEGGKGQETTVIRSSIRHKIDTVLPLKAKAIKRAHNLDENWVAIKHNEN